MIDWDRSLLENLPLLNENECHEVRQGIDQLREHWVQRHPRVPFYTLGASNYFDIAYNPHVPYYEMAQRLNPIFSQHFDWLYQRLATVIGEALGCPATYPSWLALPGFHIFLSDPALENPRPLMHQEWFVKRDDPSVLSSPIHCDLAHRVVNWTGVKNINIDRTISFTLAIQLPAAGAGMYVWDVFLEETAGQTEKETSALLQEKTPTHFMYKTGFFSLHSGQFYHQIAPVAKVMPDDARITLQGHGMLADGQWQLFW